MIPRLRLLAAIIRQSRPAVRIPHRQTLACHYRSFSTTPRTQASEDLAAFTAAFQKTSVFKRLANHPEAILALEKFARILQDSGIDLTSGKKPSTLKMMKLAANSDFREGMKRVAEEMNKAGVDFTSKEVMDEIMSLKKASEPPK